jgi:hypothetical protein
MNENAKVSFQAGFCLGLMGKSTWASPTWDLTLKIFQFLVTPEVRDLDF